MEHQREQIMDVFEKHADFFSKLSQNGGCFNLMDDENGVCPESAKVIKQFECAYQTLVYCSTNDETDCLITAKGIHFFFGDSQTTQFFAWEDVSSVVDGGKSNSYTEYLTFRHDNNGDKGELVRINLSWLVGYGANGSHTFKKQWKQLFDDITSFNRNSNINTISATPQVHNDKITNNTFNKTNKTMNIDKNKIEYVIGIDLGHGETSAAVCPLQWDTPVEQLEPAKDLEMGANKKVLPSAITILEDGKAYIGDAAFAPEILKQAKVKVCFKQAPKDINGEAENVMMRFMSEVYRRIRENNSAMLTDDNHLVYIATPSGWDKKTQELYVQMAKKVGLPMGGVTKESRAAFVRAQNDVTSGLGKNIDKGAIVFDMGSSTLDFTYMNKDLPNLIDNGYDCGASFVEKSIFSDAEKNSSAIRVFEEKYPDLIDYLVFEARKVKEQVYFSPELKVKKTINFDDFIEDEELEDEKFKLSFQPGELNELMKSNGYIQQIKDSMKDYRERFIPNQKIYAVFKTGGASRMNFLDDLICECWGVDKSQIHKDNDPSLTISQGVAEVARIDLRTDGMDEGLEDAIKRLQNSDEIYDNFVDEYGGHLFEEVRDRVADCICAFRDDDENWTLYGLQCVISEYVQDVISDESSSISNYMDAAIGQGISPIKKKVEDIVNSYSKQGMNVNLNDINVSIPTISEINLDSVMDEISNNITAESASWGKIIGGAALGGVIGFIFPVLGILGGLGYLAKKLFFDEEETEEQKQDKAMSKSLDKEDRQKVFNSLQENWDSMQESMASSIHDALTADANIKKSINGAVKKILNAYKENLKSARVLIE